VGTEKETEATEFTGQFGTVWKAPSQATVLLAGIWTIETVKVLREARYTAGIEKGSGPRMELWGRDGRETLHPQRSHHALLSAYTSSTLIKK